MPSLVEINPVISEEKEFKILSMYFRYFVTLSRVGDVAHGPLVQISITVSFC
mgnify:CR=1 FL=1